jgi:orotate phosphoribosyltransferase-like protein
MKYYIELKDNKIISQGLHHFDNATELDITKEQVNFLIENPFVIYENNEFQIDEKSLQDDNIKFTKIQRLYEIKKLLQDTDYKVIKCYEASMRQLPLPYNLEELATQRDAWREEINQLEEELKNV